MKRLMISDLDFVEDNSKFRLIQSTIVGSGIAPTLETASATSINTQLLTFLGVDAAPDRINLVKIAVASGAGSAAGAAAVGGKAIAIARATA